jgi:hypothetical protein
LGLITYLRVHSGDLFQQGVKGEASASKITSHPDTVGSFWLWFMSLLYLDGFLLVLG